MPGTGHSARYKSCISNRVKISPFEQLAKWNQDLLGADGMIPSITGGGGSLEFKKLNASDIDGVMSNPANTNLVMNNFKSKGFEIINVYSGWGPTRDMNISDINLCDEYRGLVDSELFSTSTFFNSGILISSNFS